MKKPTVIISIAEVVCGILESQQCHAFDTPNEAKDFITNNLNAESKELDTPIKADSGDINTLFKNVHEGNFSFSIGDHEYHIAFLKDKGEYNVTDDELVEALDAFCNSNRTGTDFLRVARRISDNMHRYCQNELWKFIKALIRTFASGRYDDRNATAHDQAGAITAFMDSNNC